MKYVRLPSLLAAVPTWFLLLVPFLYHTNNTHIPQTTHTHTHITTTATTTMMKPATKMMSYQHSDDDDDAAATLLLGTTILPTS